MKVLGAIALLLSFGLMGCSGGGDMKQEDSMESMLKDAQKNGKSNDSSKRAGMVKADTNQAPGNTPDANNK